MAETNAAQHELPNLVTIVAEHFKGTPVETFLYKWENIIFSIIVMAMLALVSLFAKRHKEFIPKGIANACELFVDGIDSFVCSIIGPKGRRFTPFIGTLFIYILSMNLIGLVPFMKSPTASWSTTLALAICVFVYVQFTALRELGLIGYADHLGGNPRGVLAMSVVIPALMFFLHVVTEFVRPISLSLRLRSNIWGDDMLLAMLAGFGIKGIPLMLFNIFLTILAGIVQTLVFCLLSTIYLTLVVAHDEHNSETKLKGEAHGL